MAERERAFRDTHGKLPLGFGVDVISVRGLSFKRFLDIALPLKQRVDVVIDNDSKEPAAIRQRYSQYLESPQVTLHIGDPSDGHTLEPQLISSCGRDTLNGVLGVDFPLDAELADHMTNNKTSCALKILEHPGDLAFPQYIRDAVAG